MPDICGQGTQNIPPQEGQSQNKQIHFVAVHQRFGAGNGLTGSQLRVFLQNEGSHGVTQGCDDAGHNQQQTPQESIQRPQKVLGKAGAEPVKLGKQVVEIQFLSIVLLQQEPGVAQLQNAPDQEGSQAGQTAFYRDANGIGYLPGKGKQQGKLPGRGKLNVWQKTGADQQSAQQTGYGSDADRQGPVGLQMLPGFAADFTGVHNADLLFLSLYQKMIRKQAESPAAVSAAGQSFICWA